MVLIIWSCDPGMVYDHFEKVDGQGWSWADKKRFEVLMEDSVNSYNVYANIRHTKDFPTSNLYLFITITGPNNSELRDTVELQIAKPNGKWLGSGFGNVKFVRKRFKTDVRFAHTGRYVFGVEQGMRIESIPVTDVGIRIEKYKSIK